LRTIASNDQAVPDTERVIVLHMWPGGSGAALKEWPTKRWLAVTNAIISKGYHLALTGSPEQHSLNETFMSSLHQGVRGFVTNMAGVGLADTARILSRASLDVSVNTGVMHVAAAAGVPLVALHGLTNAARWGPISDRAISIESSLSGCGYLNLGFEYLRNEPPA
jgi:ADP-heptose:LPS heptosyltransferase